jgi:hypothetical protein
MGLTSYFDGKSNNGRSQEQGILRMIAAGYSDDTGFEKIDRMIADIMAFNLPGEEPDVPQPCDHPKDTARVWRLLRAERPHCGARTRPRHTLQAASTL